MCKLLFNLHNSIVPIRKSREVIQRSYCYTVHQWSAWQSLGFLGAGRWAWWSQPLWSAPGISLQCPYFQLTGWGSSCAFLPFMILSNTAAARFCRGGGGQGERESKRARASARTRERDLLLLFWCFWLLGPWGVIGWREKPEIHSNLTSLGYEVGDAERELCWSSKTCHPLLSGVCDNSIFASSSQGTEEKGPSVLRG